MKIRIRWLLLILAAVVAAFFLWWPRPCEGPECVLALRCDEEALVDPDSLEEIAEALTGQPTFEHEIHDCQRLIVAEGQVGRFGPLIGVFPIDAAMARDTRDDFPGWIAVASVVNYDQETYAPLNIEPGWACLFIRPDSIVNLPLDSAGTPQIPGEGPITRDRLRDILPAPLPGTHDVPLGTWEAIIVGTDEFCGKRDAPVAAATLYGFAGQHTDSEAEYPVTARWHWDPFTRTHYIGIKCGDAWCMFGRPDFTPGLVEYSGDAHRSIPGWYDEQQLAAPSANGGGMSPGPVGRVYPTNALFGTRDDSEDEKKALFGSADGVVVADIQVDFDSMDGGGSAHYVDKYHLTVAGDVAEGSIWLTLSEPRRAAFVPANWQTDGSDPSEESWASSEADTEGDDQGPQLHFIEQGEHAAVGAARWRWDDDDERVWVSCQSGCCTVEP